MVIGLTGPHLPAGEYERLGPPSVFASVLESQVLAADEQAGARGRPAFRRQGNHATTNRQKIESDRWSAVADAQDLTRRAEFEAMLTLGRGAVRDAGRLLRTKSYRDAGFQTGVSGRVWRPPASASVTHLVS